MAAHASTSGGASTMQWIHKKYPHLLVGAACCDIERKKRTGTHFVSWIDFENALGNWDLTSIRDGRELVRMMEKKKNWSIMQNWPEAVAWSKDMTKDYQFETEIAQGKAPALPKRKSPSKGGAPCPAQLTSII